RGKGLMAATELVKDRKKKTPATAEATKLLQEEHKRGLLVYVAGTYDSVIRMMPPLIISKELIDKGIDILDESLNTLE
ncbi:MAG TPA: aminotransferase class III-fold pyridoxal phosphate-dependent enzyme, partial [Thermoplasmata archaeon]|nr:aminotransferase class III-fold pyridoxal phosphate-dependent enzyme [Thermoplasmata archaeon]